MNARDPLISSIEDFVSTYVPDVPHPVRSKKVIHDCIWGTELLHPWEIAILDTPLVQRLKFIHQTGFAFSVYPTCVHSRFSHTLGVLSQCSSLANKLHDVRPRLVRDVDIKQLRLASILHDVGHGLFSHTSEALFKLMPEMESLLGPHKQFESQDAHEVLSYLIVKTKHFKSFFDQATGGAFNLQDIANLIIGQSTSSEKYKSEFLYSILDGDKLDYIHRDSHFSGLPLSIDIDRLRYAVDIRWMTIDKKKWRKLSVLYSGATPLEQILVSRFLLYPILYNHHKVRACDCMFDGIIEYIRNTGRTVKLGRKDVDFKNVMDFLWGTDHDFLGIGMWTKDDKLHKLVHDLQYRRLIKRVAIISTRTISKGSLAKVLTLRDADSLASYRAYMELRDIAGEIAVEANRRGIKVEPEQVWIDLPKNPQIGRDVEEAKVHYPRGGGFVELQKIFPITEWVDLYDNHRWQGYVFAPVGTQDDIAAIAKDVLERRLHLTLNREAFSWCHVEPPR